MSATVTWKAPVDPANTADANDRPDRRLLVGYLHKTSNTLCGIKGYASLIADRETEANEAGQWARKIIAEVERMEEIFRSVGDLTRGRRNPDVGVDLPGLVHDLAAEFTRNRPCLDLNVGPVAEGEILVPVADLVLMISEVLNNCAESRGLEQGRVRAVITAEINGKGRVILKVRDNGPGMESGLVAQAADPFVTTKEGHHGVGLTRVDTLMEMHGLAWNIESRAGSGTCVSLEVAEESCCG